MHRLHGCLGGLSSGAGSDLSREHRRRFRRAELDGGHTPPSWAIDRDRVAIGGGSAGGGLAAGLAHYNRDNGGPNLALQLLIYPMIDDTHDTPSGHADTCPTIWNRAVSFKAWKMYLGDEYGSDNVRLMRRRRARPTSAACRRRWSALARWTCSVMKTSITRSG